jgi:hypothetical protein
VGKRGGALSVSNISISMIAIVLCVATLALVFLDIGVRVRQAIKRNETEARRRAGPRTIGGLDQPGLRPIVDGGAEWFQEIWSRDLGWSQHTGWIVRQRTHEGPEIVVVYRRPLSLMKLVTRSWGIVFR